MRRTIILAGALCTCVTSFAQRNMTLGEMYVVADSLNATVRAADFGVQEAAAGVEIAKNAWLPSIQASANLPSVRYF